jgi:hypothetical protein
LSRYNAGRRGAQFDFTIEDSPPQALSLETFRSPDLSRAPQEPDTMDGHYRASFQNFLGVACETIATAGNGDGGSMATIRFDLAGDDAENQLKEKAQLLAEAIRAVRGVSSVHIGVSRNGCRDRQHWSAPYGGSWPRP